MKILFVVDNLGAGGAERSLQELLGPLTRAGVIPIVACFGRRSEGVEHLLADFDVRFLPSRGRVRQLATLRSIALTEGVDLVHTTLFEADVFGRPAFAGTGIPVVTSLVNMPYEPSRREHDLRVNAAKLAIARGLEIATGAAFARHFHAISHAVKIAAADRLWIRPDKISVVLRGRDPVRLGVRSPLRYAETRRTLGIEPDETLLLTAGRQEFQKGQRYLIEAMPRIRAALPRTVLVIAGRSGAATPTLLETAKRHRVDVRFLGHREDLPDLMAAADLFVLPSLWEGLGCVLIEAMALQAPIVASRLPPVCELVEGNAELVPPADSDALATGVVRALSDMPLTTGRALAARRRFEDALTIDRSAAQMLQLFESVRASNQPSRAR